MKRFLEMNSDRAGILRLFWEVHAYKEEIISIYCSHRDYYGYKIYKYY
jgi:hypothetical protein